MPSLRSGTASLRSADAHPASSGFLNREKEAGYTITNAHCYVKTSHLSLFSCCRREVWCKFALNGIARRLFVGSRLQLAWPIHATVQRTIDTSANQMLRYALRVPSSYNGGPHTGELYGGQPRLSATIQKQRLVLLGHWTREHRRWHWVVPAVLFDPDPRVWKRKQGGQLRLLVDSIKRETGMEAVEDVIEAALDARRWRCVVKRVTNDLT